MRKVYLLFILLITGLASAGAQTLGVSFQIADEKNTKDQTIERFNSQIKLTGSDKANHTYGICPNADVNSTADWWCPSVGGTYVAHLNNFNTVSKVKRTNSYVYVKYNANDALGTAFANGGTWELLFRLSAFNGYYSDESAVASEARITKIFSSQEDGGWSLAHAPEKGLYFDYVTDDNGDSKTSTLNLGKAKASINTSDYYHVVVTVDKSAKTMKMYINGELKGSQSKSDLAKDFKYPNCGTTRRTTNMWFCIGGDPGDRDEPDNYLVHNSCRGSFVFANYYADVLTADQIAAKANATNVTKFTHPAAKNTSDLMWDVQPKSGNTVTDESPFHKIGIHGTLTTEWNPNYMRYEVVNASANNNNFAYRVYNYDTNILQSLNNGMAIEVYCKSNSATPASTISPLSFQQDGCIGAEFQKKGVVKFNYNNYGFGTAADAAKGLNLSCGTAENTLTTNYTHYVFTCDRDNNISKIYKDGIEAISYSVPQGSYTDAEKNIIYVDEDMTRQALILPNAPCQWFCFNGDTNGTEQTSCDYPFDGNIVFGRVWGKYLTADDVNALYGQATSTSTTVTTGTNGLATAIFPYPAVVPAGAEVYVVNVIKGSEASMAPYATAGEIIPYGTPVIVKGTPSTDYTFNAAGKAAVAKAAPVTNLLIGSFASKKAKADQLYAINASAARFDKVAADGTVAAQQAWLPVEDAGVSTLTLTEDVILTEEAGASTLESYTAGDVLNAKFSREFAGGKSSTVCLPFAVTSVSGGTLYSFSGVSEVDGEYVVYMSAASSPTTANTPYLFVPAADGEVTFSGSITIPATATAGSTVSGDWAFTGTYERIDWDALPVGCTAVYGYAAQAQNTISPGDFVKVKMGGSAYTPVFRAVMKYSEAAPSRSLKGGSQPSAPQRLKVVLQDANGNVTGIDSMEVIQNADEWYTVDGKKLQGKPTTKGIYIRDGKKVWVSK